MKRLFWVSLGATAGVLAVRRVTRTARAYTPAGLAHSITGLGDSIRAFGDEVRAGMAERELELRDALGIGVDGERRLDPRTAAQVTQHPLGER